MIVISNTLVQEVTDIQEEVYLPQESMDPISAGRIELNHTFIRMPSGIIGFKHTTEYAIKLMEGDLIYRIIGQPNSSPVFYLINPYLIQPKYVLSIQNEAYHTLGDPEFKNIIVFAILTLKSKISKTSCNLLGPILINSNTGVALQVINDSNSWGTKHLLSNGEKVIDASIIENI